MTLAAMLCIGALSLVQAASLPLTDIAVETVAIPMTGGSSNQYAWWARYDIGFTQATGTFEVELRIKLSGDDPGAALAAIWEQGIEDIWSGAFKIVQEDQFFYDVAFDVIFVTNSSQMHHLVNIIDGTGAMNMNNWYTENPSGWPQQKQDEAAAHEAGHMFGNFDEYAGGAVNPDGSYADVTDSLMGSGLTQTLFPRHYQFVADWVTGKAPESSFLVASGGAPPGLPGVPIPASLWLFGSALGLLGWLRRSMVTPARATN